MDRHDAKPRRPSLMAGAEPQRSAPGQPPARILADMEPAPVRRRARRSKHLRAALVGGLGLLAATALGWALVHRDGEPETTDAVAAPVAQVDVPEAPSTATLVEAAPASAPVANPFAGDAGSDDASVEGPAVDAAAVAVVPPAPTGATATGNPFSAMEATPQRASPKATPAGAPARASRPATVASAAPVPASAPGARVAPSRSGASEAGLLQTLMDNIQQPSAPARDTKAMDRLARRLDRAPMPESAPATGTIVATAPAAAAKPAPAPGVAAPDGGADPAVSPGSPARSTAARSTATGTAPAAAPQKQSLAAMLELCPTSSSVQGQRCRRQMCERAGVNPRRCARH